MEVINKLSITAEAAFDISEALGLARLDRRTLKADIEKYITHMSASGRLPWWGYFQADYLYEDSDKRLKLFIYKGTRIGIMQYWSLAGVCEAGNYTQDAEDDGLIRAWLNTKIEELPDGDDWAVRVRVNEILGRTEKTEYTEVLTEVLNDFNNDRDKEAAERLAFLQSVYFDIRGRRRTSAKDKRNRAGGQRVRRRKQKSD